MNQKHNLLSEFIKSKIVENIEPHIYILKSGGFISSDTGRSVSEDLDAIESHFDIGELLKCVEGVTPDEKAIEVAMLIYKEMNRVSTKKLVDVLKRRGC